MLNPLQVLSANLTPFFGLLVIVALTVFATRYLRLLSRCQSGTAITHRAAITLSQRPILTTTETQFFRVLQAAVGKQYIIFPQLPLWTLIQANSNDQKATCAFNNQINLKRIDFVLVNSASLMPYMAIELDDQSHERPDRQRRDAFVDNVLNQAGIKIIHIPASATYDMQTIGAQIGLTSFEDVLA